MIAFSICLKAQVLFATLTILLSSIGTCFFECASALIVNEEIPRFCIRPPFGNTPRAFGREYHLSSYGRSHGGH